MALFDKLFGKKGDDDGPLTKTADMMDEDQYWQLIKESLKETEDLDEQEQFLITSLQRLPAKEIIGFRLRTDKLLYDTYNSATWCAGYIMNGGCSDDGFEYFRNWIISRGKQVYYKAKENPDSLIAVAEEEDFIYDFESFWYVALEAFKNKTGKELYDYVDFDQFVYTEANYPPIQFTWEESDPESMKRICPRLFEKFMEKNP